jgi:hypothetical protein
LFAIWTRPGLRGSLALRSICSGAGRSVDCSPEHRARDLALAQDAASEDAAHAAHLLGAPKKST